MSDQTTWVEDAGFTQAILDANEASENLLSWEGHWPEGEEEWRSQTAISLWTHTELVRAHPVVISAEQVSVLPNVGYGEHHTIEWMRTMKLPFDPLYIGFDPPIKEVSAEGRELDATIRGALVSTTHIDAEANGLGVVVAPLFLTATEYENGPRHIGAIGFIRPPTPEEEAINPSQSSVAVEVDPGAIRLAMKAGFPDYESASHECARGVGNAAAAALQVLYFLESANVEVADQEVSRQVRRHAERKGHKIAQTVHVRQRRTGVRSNGSGEGSIDYSHRFEVRGHYKHFGTETKMAKAAPQKIVNDPKHGWCRRIWVPPFVKGPEDKPLVMKTRKVDPVEGT